MNNKINLKMMCDHCYDIVSEDSELFGFKLVDDYGYTIALKGHESCVKEMIEIIKSNFATKESGDVNL